MRRHHGGGRRTTAVVVAIVTVVLAAACGDDRDAASPDEMVSSEPTPIGSPGVDRSPYPANYGSATGDGDSLVVLDQADPGCAAPMETPAALRRPDGSWWQLPPVPLRGYLQLATADGHAVAGGIACTERSGAGEPAAGELAFAVLRADHTGWDRVDAPDVALPVLDTELTTSPGPAPFAAFAVGSEQYRVGADGSVDVDASHPSGGPPGSTDVSCVVGDRLVTAFSLPGRWSDDQPLPPTFVGEVRVADTGGSGSIEVGSVPPEGAAGPMLCAGGRVSFGQAGTQAVLDVAAGSWSTGPTNLGELSGGFVSPITGRLATAPDQTTAFLQSSGQEIIRRVGDGLWERTGRSGHVYGTGAEVLVIDADGAVARVWPA